jgi:hypothetical protein
MVACHADLGTFDPGASEVGPCNGGRSSTDTRYVSMSQHPSYGGRLTGATTAPTQQPTTPEPAPVYTATQRYAGRGCCCTAPPAVIALMPPGGGRQASTDLLLCGHHYRASKLALAAAGATILDMKGVPLTAGEWPDESR